MGDAPHQIGPYKIVREVGRGGMGVVYLARDERLDRDVAVKALPEELAADPVRLERFEREAKTLASLNHPNIAGIHGIEEEHGRRYLVLEYVEGETLGDRLDRGPVPADDAIEIAIEVAKGVEAAHEAGVIHRDLKPDNIKITPDGHVKVLDFGLAKAEEIASSATNHADSPTLTTPHSPTIPGAILGTAAYMSPEQARGRRVDKRADIWAFGVILYEMLTGLNPFAGESASDSIGAVLHKGLDLDQLPPSTTPAVRRVLSRCLERDRTARWRDIGDVRVELQRQADESPAIAGGRGPHWALTATGWIVAVAASIALAYFLLREDERAEVVRTSIVAPEGMAVSDVSISPDGRRLLFKGFPAQRGVPGVRAVDTLYIRELSSDKLIEIPNSRGVQEGRFSPDGRTIAFASRGPDASGNVRLFRVPTDLSSDPVEIMRVSDRFRVSGEQWFTWTLSGRLALLDPTAKMLSLIDPGNGRVARELPIQTDFQGLDFGSLGAPCGDRYISCNMLELSPQGFQESVAMIDLETGRVTIVVEHANNAIVTPSGKLLFARGDSVFLSGFDPSGPSAVGDLVPVQTGLATGSPWAHGQFSVSDSGTLAFVAGGVQGSNRRLALIDTEGVETDWSDERRSFEQSVHIAGDGSAVASIVGGPLGLYEVWIADPDRPRMRKLFADPSTDYYEPVLDGSGEHMAVARWNSAADPQGVILLADPQGRKPPRIILEDWKRSEWTMPIGFFPDGSSVLLGQWTAAGDRLMQVSTDGDSQPRVLLEEPTIHYANLAPTEPLILAYVAEDTGRAEAYLRRITDDSVGPAIPVTTDGAWSVHWSLDPAGGPQLHYFDLNLREWIIPVTVDQDRIRTGKPLATGRAIDEGIAEMDIASNGAMLVVRRGDDERWATRLELVQNWLPNAHDAPSD